MLTFDTEAEIGEDGTLTAKTPASVPRGTHRVVIVIDEAEPGRPARRRRRLPDLSAFRANLPAKRYPGNSVLDQRDEER